MIGLRDRHIVPDRSGRRADRGRGATGAQEPPDHALLLRPLGRDARARERELVHVCCVGVQAGRGDDSRRGSRPRAQGAARTIQRPARADPETDRARRRIDRAACAAPGEADSRSRAIPTFVGRRGTREQEGVRGDRTGVRALSPPDRRGPGGDPGGDQRVLRRASGRPTAGRTRPPGRRVSRLLPGTFPPRPGRGRTAHAAREPEDRFPRADPAAARDHRSARRDRGPACGAAAPGLRLNR